MSGSELAAQLKETAPFRALPQGSEEVKEALCQEEEILPQPQVGPLIRVPDGRQKRSVSCAAFVHAPAAEESGVARDVLFEHGVPDFSFVCAHKFQTRLIKLNCQRK